MKIISRNVDRMIARVLELQELIEKENNIAEIICIQDAPRLKENKLQQLLTTKTTNNYKIIQFNNTENKNVTLIKNSLEIINTNNTNHTKNVNTITVKIKIDNNKHYTIVNNYIKPRTTPQELDIALKNIIEQIKDNKSRSIIIGDFNSISQRTCPQEIITRREKDSQNNKHYNGISRNRGRRIDGFAQDNKMTIINTIQQGPTFTGPSNKYIAYIDYAILGEKVARRYLACKVIKNDKQMTGHHTLIIELRGSMNTTKANNNNNKKFKLRYASINDGHFIELKLRTDHLLNNWEYLERNKIEERMNTITELTYKTLTQIQNSIQYQTNTNNKRKQNQYKNNRWLNNRIQKLKIKERKAKASKNRRKLKRIQDKLIKLARRANIVKDNKDDNIWDIIRENQDMINGATTLELDTNNKLKDQKSLDKIAREKFPIIKRHNIDYLIKEPRPISIRIEEFNEAIKIAKNKKYTGPEGIKFKTFNIALGFIKETIYSICRMSFYIAKTPRICTITKGNIIPKKMAGKFRIVHIGTPLSNILENIALNRLNYAIENNNKLNKRQLGFTANRSRHDLIARTIEIIYKTRKQYPEKQEKIISFDIEGAFDHVDQHDLINKIHIQLGKSKIKHWLTDFIYNRSIELRYNGIKTSKRYKIYKGVPQGSPLGPVLWNFVISDIDEGISGNNGLELLMYADDLYLIDTGIGHKYELQANINRITNRLNNINLKISPEKSSIMYIKKRNQQKITKQEIKIYGQEIQETNKMCILGVNITNKLKLDTKNNEFKNKLNKTINKLFQINQMNLINSNKQWTILIEAYLTSIIIINNIPILAIDHKALEWADKSMIKSLKRIMDWPTNISNKLTKLLFNIKSAKIICQNLIYKSTFKEYGNAYKLIYTMLNYGIKSEQVERMTNNEPIEDIQDNRIRYFNPDKILKTPTKLKLNEIYNKYGAIWVLGPTHGHIRPASQIGQAGQAQTQGAYVAEVYKDKLLQRIEGRHQMYPISYFNSFSLIWHLIHEENITNKNIIICENNAILAALSNTTNRDWRVIELRHKIYENNWQIRIIDTKEYEQICQLITILRPIKKRCTINRIILKQPELRDYMLINDEQKRLRTQNICEMSLQHTQVTRHLCNNISSWQTTPPNWLSTRTLLMLAGMSKDNEGKLVKEEQLDRCCTNNDNDNETEDTTYINKHIALHRAIQCNKYEGSSIRSEINKLITESRTNKWGNNNNKTIKQAIQTIMKNQMKRQTLLRLLGKAALETK